MFLFEGMTVTAMEGKVHSPCIALAGVRRWRGAARLAVVLSLSAAVLAAAGLGGCRPSAAPVAAPFLSVDVTGTQAGPSLAALRDVHGASGSLAAFRGDVVIVFFGYTFCPDVCPSTLARFADVMRLLGNDAGRVRLLFVTLDPERDTPEKLAAYVSWFHPAFIGLSGDPQVIKTAAAEFKVYYARVAAAGGAGEGKGASAYSIDHSTGAWIFDPAGRARLFVRDDAPNDAVASDIRRLLAGA